jgi:hypothetical protein
VFDAALHTCCNGQVVNRTSSDEDHCCRKFGFILHTNTNVNFKLSSFLLTDCES